jgi:hypothetical protein
VLKPICVPCQRFYRQIKTGFYFIEGMPIAGEGKAEPGTSMPERWKPYKLWSGDKWRCEGCGSEIISGTGMNPLGEHYQGDFQTKRAQLNAEYQVNDC